MALCDHCQAEIEAKIPPMDPQWFCEDRHEIGGRYIQPEAYRVLRELWVTVGHVVTRDKLYSRLYWDREMPLPKTIDVHIVRLRKALKGTPYRIETAWGRGFRLIKEQYD